MKASEMKVRKGKKRKRGKEKVEEGERKRGMFEED